MKGVAANLGISVTQDTAAKLEKGLREIDPAVPVLLSDFESAVARQLTTIRAALGEAPSVRRACSSPIRSRRRLNYDRAIAVAD